MKANFGIAIHGGAGTITRKAMNPEKEAAYKMALQEALDAGYSTLLNGYNACDAVQQAVICLENNPLFNAGKGSVFNHEGKHEMDASIMRGDTLQAGAAAGVCGVQNPILLARAIMDKSEHVLLIGNGAEEFARQQHLIFQTEEYFFTEQRYKQWQEALPEGKVQLDHTEGKKFGTVGAVAIDMNGNLAAATSTGGMTNKRWGRVGDTPLIGAGSYANNATCAVSCTGHGEFFIRSVVAYDVSCLMEYKGLTLSMACNEVINNKLVKLGGEGGLIAVDNTGEFCLCFNSEGMYRGWRSASGNKGIAIYND